MPSHQNSAPGGKAAKFVQANPLGPMADPFAGMGDDEKEYHKALSENINTRMTKAMGELKERHANGTNEVDNPDFAPTGAAYHAAAKMEKGRKAEEQRREQEQQQRLAMKQDAKNVFKDKENNDGEDANDDDDDSDDEYDDLLNDNDAELEMIRNRRIAQLRAIQAKAAEHKALGHGDVRTITQDEFLPECTGKSEFVAVHFFHKEFERCKIMDHHLKIVAAQHLGCKFLRLDAEKSPFFVHKLQIKMLPALIVFQEGQALDRLHGFEGLAVDPSEPDKWHTGRLMQWISTTGAIKYTVPTEEIKEEMARMGIRPKGTVWSGTSRSGFKGARYDSDDE